jgi:hypothetical protein
MMRRQWQSIADSVLSWSMNNSLITKNWNEIP